jgi:hypothetical protein
MHQPLLPDAMQCDEGSTTAGTVDGIGFRKPCEFAIEIAEIHGIDTPAVAAKLVHSCAFAAKI